MLRLVRWLARRPLWLLHAFGGVVGWAVWAASPTYRRRFAENARIAGLAPTVSRPAIAHAGRALMELALLWFRPPAQPVGVPVEWHGAEHVDAVHATGRGVLLLTPHLGSFEFAAQSFAERFGARAGPLTVMYRPARKAWLRPLVARAREREGLVPAPSTLAGLRQMMRALRRGETVGILPDQVPPQGMGVWAPFFGRPAYTMTLAARLVQQTNAVPLLIWAERLPHGRGFVVRVAPFAEPLPAGDEAQAECAAAVNRAMERLILECPQQYLWGYHRYKQPRSSPAAE